MMTICHEHSNDVAQKIETPGNRTILSRDITFMSRWRLRYAMTANQVGAAIDAILV